VSQARHWCQVCKVWTGGHKSQILKHESGRGHIEQEEKMLKEMRQREKEKKAADKDVLAQLEEIDRAARKAMGMAPTHASAWLPAGGAVGGGAAEAGGGSGSAGAGGTRTLGACAARAGASRQGTDTEPARVAIRAA